MINMQMEVVLHKEVCIYVMHGIVYHKHLHLHIISIHPFYKAFKLFQRLDPDSAPNSPLPSITLLQWPPHNHPDQLAAFQSQDHHAEVIQFVLQKCDHLLPKLQGYTIEQNDILQPPLEMCIW